MLEPLQVRSPDRRDHLVESRAATSVITGHSTTFRL